MSRIIKRFLFTVPMLACMFAFSSVGQEANASTDVNSNKNASEITKKSLIGNHDNNTAKLSSNSNGLLNQGMIKDEVKLTDNSLLGQQNQQNKGDANTVNLGVKVLGHNSFGVQIGGCYYQVEQYIDAYAGTLYCGTLIVFCQDSVDIYTAGTNCS